MRVARAEDRSDREALRIGLRLADRGGELRAVLRDVCEQVQRWSGCEAVGVRLREGLDFPYCEACGFSPDFLARESRLCAVDRKGEIVRDADGDPVLECRCGDAIARRFVPGPSFFTERGSFWTHSTTELLKASAERERPERLRRGCNAAGYESMALIPLGGDDGNFGLLQLNSRKRGWFTAEKVALFEEIGEAVARAVEREWSEEALRALVENQKLLIRELNHRVKNNLASVLGLLRVAGERAKSGGGQSLAAVLDSLAGRIRSLSTVHEMLARDAWRPLELYRLIERVTEVVHRAALPSGRVSIRVAPSPVRVSSQQAQPLTLVFNELATNAFKYALVGHGASKIRVAIATSQSAVRVRFSDDGPGYPTELLLEGSTRSGTGIELIRSILAHNLAGELRLRNDRGAVAEISFPRAVPRDIEE